MNNESLKPPKGYRAYSILLLDNNIVDRREYTNKIYNKLLERYNRFENN